MGVLIYLHSYLSHLLLGYLLLSLTAPSVIVLLEESFSCNCFGEHAGDASQMLSCHRCYHMTDRTPNALSSKWKCGLNATAS